MFKNKPKVVVAFYDDHTNVYHIINEFTSQEGYPKRQISSHYADNISPEIVITNSIYFEGNSQAAEFIENNVALTQWQIDAIKKILSQSEAGQIIVKRLEEQ